MKRADIKRAAWIVRIDRRFARSAARRMRADAWPTHMIVRALQISRRRLEVVLSGSALWSAGDLATMSREMERAA